MDFFNELSEIEKITLVSINTNVIQYIDNPSEEIQLSAVKNKDYPGYSIQFINNPSEAVIKYCLYECDISHTLILNFLYYNLTSDEDKMYFKMKYGNIIND